MKIILLISLLICGNVKAQSSFEVKYGTTQDEIIVSVVEMSNSYIAVGKRGNAITNTYHPLLLIMDLHGNILTDTTFGINGSFTHIIKKDNNIYLFGTVVDSANTNILAIRTDTLLNVQWQKMYGIADKDEQPYDIISHADTIVIYGSKFFDDKFLLQINTNGDSLNYLPIDQLGMDIPGKISLHKGHYLISYMYGGSSPQPNSSLAYITKESKDLIIDTTISIPNNVFGSINYLHFNDSLIMYLGRIGDTSFSSTYTTKIGVGITNLSGNDIKFTTIGHSTNEYTDEAFESLIKTNNKVFLLGNTSEELVSDWGDKPSKILVSKINYNLNKEWIRYYGQDSIYNISFSITPTSDYGAIILAYQFNYINASSPERDIYIIKIDSSGISLPIGIEASIPDLEIFVYPNPTSSKLTIKAELLNKSTSNIEIFDINGRLIFSKEYKNSDIHDTIDVKSWPKGIYLVRLMLNREMLNTQKVIIH